MQVSELHCEDCDTQVRGHFCRCEFCGLDDDQRSLLMVFLRARGNAKELERHLGVSYPTARARLDQLLVAVGISDPQERSVGRREVLDAVANGRLNVDDALAELDGSHA